MERLQRKRSKTILTLACTGLAVVLSGCGQARTLASAREPKFKPKDPVQEASPEAQDVVEESNKVDTDNVQCDELVRDMSEQYKTTLQKKAPQYYKGVVDSFSEDFIKYPFCLEDNYFVVHKLEHKMRANDQYKTMPSSSFDTQLNLTITDQFTKHESQWQGMCQDWAERNKAHQLEHLKMVEEVLGLEDLPEDELKGQIEGWFGWQPWWEFFRSVAQKGCVRQYAKLCTKPSQAATRRAKQLVLQTTGDSGLTWHAFEAPTDSFLEAGERWKHQVTLTIGRQLAVPNPRCQ